MAHDVTNPTSRRDFIGTAAAAGAALFLRPASGAASEPKLQGIFPIMQTPFADSGALDLEALPPS